MGFSGTGAASGALSGAASGAAIGSALPGIGTAIGAVGGAVIGGLSGGLSGGDDGKTAANNRKKEALLSAEKYQLNAVLMSYEADRIRDETNLDAAYVTFASDRQAKWLAQMGDMDKSIAQGKAAKQYKDSVDDVLNETGTLHQLTDLQAANIQAKGAAEASKSRMTTRFKTVMQDEENSKNLGLVRASTGARMVEFSGSALDVIAHEEAMATIRHDAVKILGDMQTDDIQYDTSRQVNYIQQKASIQALSAMNRVGTSTPDEDPVFQAQLARADVNNQRDVSLVKEEGWRTVMKMRMGSQSQTTKTVLGIGEQQMMAGGSMSAASTYSAAGDLGANTSLMKSGKSLLTGAYDLFKTAKTEGWFESTDDTTDWSKFQGGGTQPTGDVFTNV